MRLYRDFSRRVYIKIVLFIRVPFTLYHKKIRISIFSYGVLTDLLMKGLRRRNLIFLLLLLDDYKSGVTSP